MVSSTLVAVLGALPLAFAASSPPYASSSIYASSPPYTSSSPYASLPPYTSGNATSTYQPTATSTTRPSVQTVAVGKDGFVFTPDTVVAKVGEEITFQFFPKNHSVVQADFNNPCNPAAAADRIFSGFIPVAPPGPGNQTFTIKVKDDTPIWLYCAALLPSPHCAAGMVAVINPPKGGPNTLDAFRAAAAKTNTSTAPGTPPTGGNVTTNTPLPPGGTTTGLPTSTGAASSLVVGGGAVGGLVAVFAGLLL